ncbi:hypothetical protein SAVIM40S_02038 [Streptomyces avidinii]
MHGRTASGATAASRRLGHGRGGHDMGRGRPPVHGRGAVRRWGGRQCAHLPGSRSPLRAGAGDRPDPGRDHGVRGAARRPAGVAPARQRLPAEHDHHPGWRTRPGCPAPGCASPSARAGRRRCPPAGTVRTARTRSTPSRRGWPPTRRRCARTSCLLLGDQVYADALSRETRAWLAARRDLREPPGAQVADYEEYTRLYYESWLDPEIRWLLSTVPSLHIFDDHDVIDDWNTSAAWLAEMRVIRCWWRERVLSGLMSVLGVPAPGQSLPRRAGRRRAVRGR